MCGISSVVRLGPAAKSTNSATDSQLTSENAINGHKHGSWASRWTPRLNRSLEQISHRGPDASAVWLSPDDRIGLGHCRLSINDLTPHGNQPLHDADGAVHAVVNGEIYDSARLRKECETDFGYVFEGKSDSELVIALYKHCNVPEFLHRLRGEFAFVIYDGRSGETLAARDRSGVKPLFWTTINDESDGKLLLFGSEMKALAELGWKPEWDVDNITLGASAFGDMTDFKGVKKVRPGHYLRVTPRGEISDKEYWDYDYSNKYEVDKRTPEEIVQSVRELLLDSVRLRIQADVPVGVYLSGGLDSSALVGMAKYLVDERGASMGSCDAKDRIACFTVSFDKDSGFDESDVAARTADHLGVSLFLQGMDETKMAENFEDCIWHNEQPCFDLNTVGKFCLSDLVRSKGYKVVLTGEGSDEIFCGYPWHLPDLLLEPDYSRPDLPLQKDPKLREETKSRIPDSHATFSRLAVGGLDPIDKDLEEGLNKTFAPVGNNLMQPPNTILHPLLANRYSLDDRLRMQMNEWPPEVRRKIREEWHPIHTGMYSWLKSILPNWAFSTVGDRGEMAHSVEARPPFTDYPLVELVNRIPPSFKQYYNEESGQFSEKWVLREACKPFITEELYTRKKQPYLAPVKYHVGGPIHLLLSRLVTPDKVEKLGFVHWPIMEDLMTKAFGPDGESSAFKRCLNVAGWVVLSERLGVPAAVVQ